MTTSAANNASAPASIRERIPPQDLDAEMALLGSMMMSRDAISDVVPIIGRGDSRWLYVPAHQKLFETLLDLYDNPAKAIDLIVVSDELRRRDLLEFIGGQDYMIQLAESFAEWANAEHYARIVRDRGMLRDLIQCAGEISESAYSGIDDAKDILDVAEQKIFQVTEKRVSGQASSLRELIDRLNSQLQNRDGAAATGLPTGFTALDELTSGFQPGDLIVVAARPSMGKTALGLSMAHYATVEHQHPIAFFSMEMSSAQVTERLVCSHGHGTDAQRLRRRMLSDEEINYLLVKVCPELAGAPLFIDDTPGMSAMELRSKARRLRQRHQIEAIFVDYLQLMHIPNSENRQVEIATISRQLKGVARELNIPVIAMAQLNRMPEGRSDKRPLMSDLRESGAIEQDADVVLLIHREEYYHPEKDEVKGKAELIIAKQRNGPTGTVELQFNKKFTRFANFSPEPEPHYQSRHSEVPF
ncbi:MAG: replicative DNA helicase [Planctomycetes bacterium]|nr:replicative DNA helicase [Planctomycetota bacterium]MBI3833247.1 replicative DNA helicase [Planctomycetota bacterium]